MADFFDKKDIESVEEDFFSQDDTDLAEGPSQLEAAGLGAAQGLTFDFGDEAYGGVKGLYDYLTSEEDKTLGEEYEEERDVARERIEGAEEAHPGTYLAADVLSGVVPALLTGGASAAAGVGKALGKEAVKGSLKAASKQAAKTGAKYGAASGLGRSEAELLEGDLGGAAKDTLVGAGLGAGLGAALPVALKGAGSAIKSTKDATLGALEAITPGSETIKAAYKYGKLGKELSEEVVDEDLIATGTKVYKNLLEAKKTNNFDAAKKQLDELGYTVKTKKSIDEAIDDLEKIAREDVLDLSNKDLLPRLKALAGKDLQAEKLAERAAKTALRKKLQAEGLDEQAIIKGEKALAKEQIKTGDSLETITDINRPMNDLEIPLATPEGVIGGTRGKFKNVDGEEYTKTVLSDTTDYQPEISKLIGPDGRPIIKTKDLGSGKITAIVGDIEKKVTKDLDNLTISEVETLRNQLNQLTKMESMKGASADPAMRRATELAVQLKELTDKVIEKAGDSSLIEKRARISDLLSAEELLGVNKKLRVRKDLDKAAKISQISDQFGFQKGFKTRQEGQIAEDLLGKEIITPELSQHYGLLKKVNKLLGREGQDESISRSALYKKAVGDVPNAVGRAVKAVEDIAGKYNKTGVGRVANRISDLPEETIIGVKDRLLASEDSAAKMFGNNLQKAMDSEGPVKNAMIWSLSQQPAFRELVRRELPNMDEEMSDSLGGDVSSPLNTLLEDSPTEENVSDFTKSFETTQSKGYVPEGSDKSGVTIASGLDLGNFDKLDELNIPAELKEKLQPFVGLKGEEARNVAPSLQLSDEEVTLIDEAMGDFNDAKINTLTEGMSEEYQTEEFDDALDSLFTNSPSAAKALINRVKEGNVDGAIDKGVEWNKSGGKFMSGLLRRRMEELYKMFPEKADLIQSEGKLEYDKYQGQTQKTWDELNTIEEKVQEVDAEIDRVNQQQSAGDSIPLGQLDSLLQKVNELNIGQEDKDSLEREAVSMDGYSDGQRLKEMMRKLQGIS